MMANSNRQQPNAESIWKMRFRPNKSVADARDRKKVTPNFSHFNCTRMCVCSMRACGCVCACTIFIHGFVGAAHTQSHTAACKIGEKSNRGFTKSPSGWGCRCAMHGFICVNLLCWCDESFRKIEEGTVIYVHSKSVSCVCHLMPNACIAKENYALAGYEIANTSRRQIKIIILPTKLRWHWFIMQTKIELYAHIESDWMALR